MGAYSFPPMPVNFVEVAMRETSSDMQVIFGRGRHTIRRWLSMLPPEVRNERVARICGQQTAKSRGAFYGLQNSAFEAWDENRLRANVKQSGDMFVAAYRAAAAKAGWPVREYAR